ncbi:hypothetical protein WAI453_007228 [Rhynchosporium graminicola]|uniref:Zn(2)-C6 fungal-type domain-containing protein n=1 Tax=Rhynchosporium graminicola TaxID=2792576 RepID=A0A1E1LSE0_9HELO|nr:uncharacterized protein RCO7_00661 [Rhynchosporium commune]
MSLIIHCVACALSGSDCVDQASNRSRSCVRCKDRKKNCENLPQISHVAYSVWTRSADADENEAHADLVKVLKAWKALKPLQSSGLLSAPLASEVTTSVVAVVAQQGQTAGGVPPALVLGLRRAS